MDDDFDAFQNRRYMFFLQIVGQGIFPLSFSGQVLGTEKRKWGFIRFFLPH